MERLAKPPVDPAKQFCTVGRLLSELAKTDDQEFGALTAALANRDWTAADITKALQAEGHTVNLRHVRQHRNGEHFPQSCLAPHDGVIP